MNIYKLTQNVDQDDNVYTSIIVTAKNIIGDARMMHPNQKYRKEYGFDDYSFGLFPWDHWVKQPCQVNVELLGISIDDKCKIISLSKE